MQTQVDMHRSTHTTMDKHTQTLLTPAFYFVVLMLGACFFVCLIVVLPNWFWSESREHRLLFAGLFKHNILPCLSVFLITNLALTLEKSLFKAVNNFCHVDLVYLAAFIIINQLQCLV